MQEVTTADVLAAESGTQIVDVRETPERATGMIAGAIHIPMSELADRVDELDKSRRVIAVCHAGGRSARVAEALTGLGFTADTMGGGMSGWEAEGLPMVAPA